MKRASTMWTTVARAPLTEREGRVGPCFGQGRHLITSLRGVYSQHRKRRQLGDELTPGYKRLRRFTTPDADPQNAEQAHERACPGIPTDDTGAAHPRGPPDRPHRGRTAPAREAPTGNPGSILPGLKDYSCRSSIQTRR